MLGQINERMLQTLVLKCCLCLQSASKAATASHSQHLDEQKRSSKETIKQQYEAKRKLQLVNMIAHLLQGTGKTATRSSWIETIYLTALHSDFIYFLTSPKQLQLHFAPERKERHESIQPC